jgi:hypothetical protein
MADYSDYSDDSDNEIPYPEEINSLPIKQPIKLKPSQLPKPVQLLKSTYSQKLQDKINPLVPNLIPSTKPSQPEYPEHELNSQMSKENISEKKKYFEGSLSNKNGWIKCFYCDKYHPNSMHLPGIDYCGHCWGWLNSEQLKLTEGIYTGDINIIEIKNFLKLTYPLHSNTCINSECIYNKITTHKNNGTLHYDFSIELGFIKKEKITNNSDLNKTQINSQYKINKKGNLRINFNASSISI